MKPAQTIAALVLSSAMAGSSLPAISEDNSELTVQTLLEWCKDKQASPTSAFCLGAVRGAAEVLAVIGDGVRTGQVTGVPPPDMCVPKGENLPTGGAMIQAFINWAEANPKHWSDRGTVGIIYALSETWPC